MSNLIQRSLIILLTILLFLLLVNGGAGAEPRLIDDFSQGLNPGWKTREFQGKTSYRPTIEDNIPCLKAESNTTASGLFYEVEYDPRQYPVLTWKWKVDDIIEQGDATKKAGDDYAARIYVVFPSFFFWQTRSLNYIWANKLPKGEAVPNPYTANAIMIAVESGPDRANKWQNASRNIYRDYIRYFGRKPGKVGAIAIMTDTDNTLGKATAYYGPIRIHADKNSPLK